MWSFWTSSRLTWCDSLCRPLLNWPPCSCSLYHRDDDDINDVASMAGVNLNEENARILATSSELVGTKIRSCKDESFLPAGLLHRRILETGEPLSATFTTVCMEVEQTASGADVHYLFLLLVFNLQQAFGERQQQRKKAMYRIHDKPWAKSLKVKVVTQELAWDPLG